jgi:hypothetical protein
MVSAGGALTADGQSRDALLTLDDAAFVEAAYVAILGRPPDEDGRRSYLAKLAAGESKEDLVVALATSVEAKLAQKTPSWILALVNARRGHQHWLWKTWPFKLMLPRLAATEQDHQQLIHALGGMAKANEVRFEADRQAWRAEAERIHAMLIENAASQRDASLALERALREALAQRVAPVEENLAAWQANATQTAAAVEEALRVLRVGTAASNLALTALGQELNQMQSATRSLALRVDEISVAPKSERSTAVSAEVPDAELSAREQALVRRLQVVGTSQKGPR